jgi:hypothetical protein
MRISDFWQFDPASSANSQPWKFIYATKDTEEWNTLFNLLLDFKIWAKNVAILIVV